MSPYCFAHNAKTGETYRVETKRSLGKLYFSCDYGNTWHHNPMAARLAKAGA